MFDSAFLEAFSRTVVIGAFGGAGLVLTELYSRRGPMIYPVYAAILFAVTLSLARTSALTFEARFVAAFAGLAVSTAIAMMAIIIRTARARRAMANSPRPRRRGGMPGWAPPLLLLLLAMASAGAAYVSM